MTIAAHGDRVGCARKRKTPMSKTRAKRDSDMTIVYNYACESQRRSATSSRAPGATSMQEECQRSPLDSKTTSTEKPQNEENTHRYTPLFSLPSPPPQNHPQLKLPRQRYIENPLRPRCCFFLLACTNTRKTGTAQPPKVLAVFQLNL